MAYLFKLEDKIVFPLPETLLIEPFKSIWERDKSEGKQQAIKEFTYIEFMSSHKKSNPFRDYSLDIKGEVVKKNIGLKGWKPCKLIEDGINLIETIQEKGSSAFRYYLSAKEAVQKLEEYLRVVDLTDTDDRGRPIYKPKDITSALIDTEKVVMNLKSLEKKVQDELMEETKTRSGKEISYFAKRESLGK